MTLEEKLTASLHARADQFEPSEGSYVRLQRRLAAAPPAESDDGRARLGARLIAAAASIALLAGVGAFAFRQSDGDLVTASPGDESAVLSADAASSAPVDALPPIDDDAASTGTVDDATQATEAMPAGIGIVAPAPAGILGPPRATWNEAARDFLELIQMPSEMAILEPSGDQVTVSSVTESGEARPVTVLTIGSRNLSNGQPGYVVVAADSPRVVIDSPAPLDRVGSSQLVVAGQGEGFEGVVTVQVVSANDGVTLVKTGVQAGNFGRLADYRQTVTVHGTENAWVVVASSTGSDVGLPEFSATPITVAAPMPTATYTVTNIAPDDADGGLVARAAPGGDRIAVIPTATEGIRVRGVPYLEGDQRWVNVWLPAELTAEAGRSSAWVNSAYLAFATEIAVEAREAIAADFVAAVETGGVGFEQLPWTARRSIAVGWGGASPARFSAEDLVSASVWAEPRAWDVPEERFAEPTLIQSLREFVGFGGRSGDSEFSVDVTTSTAAPVSPYGSVMAELESRFAGASSITISGNDADTTEWKTTTLFLEATSTAEIEIVGVIVDFWVP